MECSGLIGDIAADYFQGKDILRYRARTHKAGCAGMGAGCG
jgi:nitrogen fixation protein NifB